MHKETSKVISQSLSRINRHDLINEHDFKYKSMMSYFSL